jgi:hypothetical protein
MKRIGIISTAVLSLALGVAAPAYAQQEQRDQQDEQKAKSAQEEKKAQPVKSAKQEEKPAARQEKTAKPEEQKAQQQDKNTRNEGKDAQQQHVQQDQSGKQERASGGNGRIPDDRFKANFGEQHRFRVSQGDYSRDRRFQYGGYWFGFVDSWPSNWLYTQDVFVIEINGVYYLCNPMYPGVNILLSVTL